MILSCEHYTTVLHRLFSFGLFHALSVACLILVEKKKETITESAGRQQKKKIGKDSVNKVAKLEPVSKQNLETEQEKPQLCYGVINSPSVPQ